MTHTRLLSSIFMTALGWTLLTGFDPNNPPTGRTGAPGETTCQNTDCHGTGSYTGTVEIAGIPDTVLPNATYALTLTNTSNAVKAGFELTSLNAGTNTMAGTLTAGTGVNIGTAANGRKYARQASPHTLSGGSTSWNFTWKAPATGDSITFYYVSLCANNNGHEDGDNVLVANKGVVVYNPVVSGTEAPTTENTICYYNGQNQLVVNLLKNTAAELTVFDSNGQLVMSRSIAQQANLDISHLGSGIFIANIKVGNHTLVRKFAKF